MIGHVIEYRLQLETPFLSRWFDIVLIVFGYRTVFVIFGYSFIIQCSNFLIIQHLYLPKNIHNETYRFDFIVFLYFNQLNNV